MELGYPTRPSRIIDLCLLALPLISGLDGLGTMPELVWERNHDSVGRRIASPLLSLPSQRGDPVSDLAHDRPPVREQWHLVVVSKPHHARRIGYGLLGAS